MTAMRTTSAWLGGADDAFHERLRSDGQTLQLIASELTRSGITTKTGKSARWTHQAVARIFSRER